MVWHLVRDAATHAAWEPALRALARTGLQTAALGDASPEGPGILFLAGASDGERDTVHRLSRGGVNRVLVFVAPRLGGTPEVAWELLAAGASDVLEWRSGAAEIAAARLARWGEVDRLVDSPLVADNLIGRSPAWIRLLRQTVEVACYTTAPALLIGESGTGKELLARLIHTLDRRGSKKALVVADCTTVVPELAGSEFFGHERGAFTNALQARDGAFALADGGTLFLDEVGELPPALQAQLLRVVQEKTYKRVGSNQWRRTEFRLICATNRELRSEVEQGLFRRDLYHRLASWTLRVPSLRERAEDALLLAHHFLAELMPDRQVPEFDDAVRAFLTMRAYDGNVRDLRQLMVRIAARHVGPGPVSIGDIPEDERPAAPPDWTPSEDLEPAIRTLLARGAGLRDIGRAATDMAVRVALENARGNLQRAAHHLGVTDRALQLRFRNRSGAGGNGSAPLH